MRNFDTFDSMVFYNCNAVHTMFMSMNIDVVFVDFSNMVCKIRKNVRPWNPILRSGAASSVIELPEGTIGKTLTEKGDILDLNAELTDAEKLRQNTNNLVPHAAETVVPYKKAGR